MLHCREVTGIAVPPPMEPTENFWGNLIKTVRKERGVTQRQLAAGAKVNRSTLRRIEDGEADGDIRIMERLLDYLEYELDAFPREGIKAKRKIEQQAHIDPDLRSKIALQRLMAMTHGPIRLR